MTITETTTDPTAPPAQATPPTPQTPPASETDWKAEARKWEERAKANNSAAEELARIKQSQMSDAEKATAALADAQAKLVEAEAKATRRGVALEHKLSPEDAALLDAVTDEKAMRTLAERLANDAKKRTGVVPSEGRPTTRPQDDGMRALTRRLFSQQD